MSVASYASVVNEMRLDLGDRIEPPTDAELDAMEAAALYPGKACARCAGTDTFVYRDPADGPELVCMDCVQFELAAEARDAGRVRLLKAVFAA
jgi:hypothetical protein